MEWRVLLAFAPRRQARHEGDNRTPRRHVLGVAAGIEGPAEWWVLLAFAPRRRARHEVDNRTPRWHYGQLMAMRLEDLRVSAAAFFAYDPPSSFCFEPGRVRHPSRNWLTATRIYLHAGEMTQN